MNGWLGIPSSAAAENMAQAGWDSLTVDLQHGLVDYQTAVGMLQAISTTDATPLVRVPWNEPGIIGKMLDAGAYGVICPMVNSRAEAEALVRACRYPPDGERSFGPVRAAWYGGADYAVKANETVLVLPMIETRAAVENLDEILSVPGVDGVYVGPADLGLSHGYPAKGDRDEEELLAIIRRIAERAATHGKSAGIHCGVPAYARRMIEDGYRLVTIQADNQLLNAAARRAVELTRHGVSEGSGGGLY
ncbi:MAG: aldolase/citrate lyase family protein [Pseudomonadota bacterium]